MYLRPPRMKLTDTRCPSATLFRAARIEFLDLAPKLREVGADAVVLVHRAYGPIEEAVRLPGRLADLALAHRADRVDALAEFGAVGILRDQIGDERVDPLLELGLGRVVDGHQPDDLFGRHHRPRLGRGPLQH